MKRKLAHIGIAVPKLADAVPVFEIILGKGPDCYEEVTEQKVKTAIFGTGESRVELLEGTADDSPISKYIAKKGSGIHHLCIQVEDLEAELRRLKEAGLRLIDEVPRKGAEGMLVAFIHPKSTAGILVELNQQPNE
ncbi:MAG: methylmalonyl-CoA epimerase [candidate division Zixibacteria bacterium]|nr:methylmalonyl-CoA epimerase [candidate division Zixibacteria bacterium]